MAKIDDKQIIFINSRNRISGNDNDFTYAINLRHGNRFNRVSLLMGTMPKSYYNVKDGINYFTLMENFSEIKIIVPVGNYNRNSFAQTLSNLLTENSPNGYTYIVSYPNPNNEADTGRYTYTVSNNSGDQPSFSFDTNTFINELMGFTESTTQILIFDFSDNILISDVVINMQPYSTILVHSDLIANPIMTGVNTDILQPMFPAVGSPSYSNIQWINYDFESFAQFFNNSNSGIGRFWVTDEDNIDLDTNGIPIQLVVMFWQKNESLKLLTDFMKYVSSFLHNMYSRLNQ